MEEFKILLIDDDDEQEQLLKEAVDYYNKKVFIDQVKRVFGVTDEKVIAELEILDNTEQVYEYLIKKYGDSVEIEKKDIDLVTYTTAKTPEQAMSSLYKENYHALIVDLKLESGDDKKNDADYSGNVLLENIVRKEIIPIIVRTGFPSKVKPEIKTNIINAYPKENPTLVAVIEELINSYISTFKMFTSGGEIDQNIKDFFWNVLPDCFQNKDKDIGFLDKETQQKVVIRYVSSWLNNKYMFEGRYLDVEPIEMYMFPNPIDKICNCDIYEDQSSNEKFIVLTPSCDLANNKAENILFAKIQKDNEISDFTATIQTCSEQQNKGDGISQKNKKKIASWSRNSHEKSMRYHYLPKVSFFEGGFIDFSILISLKYDWNQNQFPDRDFKKIGTITEAFKRDIIARFSSYYQRQGQPTFNTESVLKYYL